MRFLSFALGVLFLVGGLSGLLVVGLGPRDAVQVRVTQALADARVAVAPTAAPQAPVEPLPADAAGDTHAPAGAAIERVQLPAIGLDSEVVPARIVRVGAAQTWEVPAFKAGHADGTAGAGAPGNAVLLGHVTSLDAGNVFKSLDRVHAGDDVVLSGDGQRFTYRVTAVERVPRDDVSVVDATDMPSVTLITCTGTWLTAESDFSHRLVVRAELVS